MWWHTQLDCRRKAGCADAVETSSDQTVSIGGPDVLSRQQVVEMAFQAVGKVPRIAHVPVPLFTGIGRLMHPVHPRLGELLDFAARAFSHDSIAPALGTRRLDDHFAAVAARRPRDPRVASRP